MLTNDQRVTEYAKRRSEMRGLVDLYDSIQNLRKGADNKRRSHEQGYDMPTVTVVEGDGAAVELEEPAFLTNVRDRLGGIEESIAKHLELEAKEELLGRWCMSIDGIGGVLAAGLLAFVDFHRCCCYPYRGIVGKERKKIPVHDCPGLPTAGAIWSHAGLLDKKVQPWEVGKRRPYNVRLKTHMWKIADQFRRASVNMGKMSMTEEDIVKTLREEDKYKALDDDELFAVARAKKARMAKKLTKLDNRLYTRLYMERKERDTRYNEEGRFADLAAESLETVKKRKIGISPAQRKCWESGRIQPCGIDLRAMRYAAKIFLSHFHDIGRQIYFGGGSLKPWVIEHGGHSHYIPPPGWPMK